MLKVIEETPVRLFHSTYQLSRKTNALPVKKKTIILNNSLEKII